MKTTTPPEPSTCAILTPAESSLNIVVICDNVTSAASAHNAIESLSCELDEGIQVRVAYWSFDSLDPHDLQHLSMRLASRADMLVVASSVTSAPAPHVRAWILGVMREAGKQAPALAAFDGNAQACGDVRSPLCDFVNGVASLWHAKFFCNQSLGRRSSQEFVRQLGRRSRQKQHAAAWNGATAKNGKSFHGAMRA